MKILLEPFMLYGIGIGVVLGGLLSRLGVFGMVLIACGVVLIYEPEQLNASNMSVFLILGGVIGVRSEWKFFTLLWSFSLWVRDFLSNFKTYTPQNQFPPKKEIKTSKPSADEFWDTLKKK